MTAWTVHDEFAAMRARFHRALAVSIGVHALLAAALLLVDGARPRVPEIIEVTWLEPQAPAVAAAPPAVAPVAAPQASPPPEKPGHAARPDRREAAERTPAPGSGEAAAAGAAAAAERAQRLAALAASRPALGSAAAVAPPSASARAALATAPDPGASLARATSATMMPVAERGRPVALQRGPGAGPGGTALALKRGPAVAGSLGSLATAALPAAGGGIGDSEGGGTGGAAREAAQAGGLAGAGGDVGDILLEGPAAGREVVQRVLPGYPAWARRQAMEAVVTLRFTVLPDGRLREDIAVERTGGFRDFDESALTALRGWRFAPLAGGDAAGQWGTITFRFRLRG